MPTQPAYNKSFGSVRSTPGLRAIQHRLRRRRFDRFMRLFAPTAEDRILDVGGNPDTWGEFTQVPSSVMIINPHPFDSPHPPRVRSVVGDACAMEFADGEFDIGYSNSVIEHLGTWERQQRFASEIRRTARRLWVQTPARSFPVEPHYMTPFIHFLPKSLRRRLVRRLTVWGIVHRPDLATIDARLDEIRLLGYREMRELFPDCTILRERFLGFTKSYIAIRR
jgi:hypothetical protein